MPKPKILLTLLVMFLGAFLQPAAAETLYQVREAILGDDGVQRLEILADSYHFSPNYLVVKTGIPVELTLRRQTLLVPHDFVLEVGADDIRIEQELGREGHVLRFTVMTPGKYPFYCSKQLLLFESHRHKGMEGVLDAR